MPEKDSALGQLNAMKARHTEKEAMAGGDGDRLASQPRRLMAPHYWRAGAILMAVFCGVFLSLAYRESKGLSHRRSQIQVIESRLADSENRLMALSTEIGTRTAQKEALTSEILQLRSEAAKNAESAAENRILEKSFPVLKSEHSALSSEVATLKQSKAELEVQVRIAEKKLADVDAAIEPQQRALQNVINDLTSKQKRLLKIENDLADKQAAVTGAQRLLEDYKSQLESTKSHYEDLKKRLTSMNDERDQFSTDISEKQAALKVLRDNYNEEKTKLDNITAESKRLNARLIQEQNSVEEVEKRLRLLYDEAATLESRRTQLLGTQKDLREAKKELAGIKAEISIKDTKIDDLAQKIAATQAAVLSRQKMLEDLEANIKEHEATRFDLAKEISRMQGQQEMLKQNVQPVDAKQGGQS